MRYAIKARATGSYLRVKSGPYDRRKWVDTIHEATLYQSIGYASARWREAVESGFVKPFDVAEIVECGIAELGSVTTIMSCAKGPNGKRVIMTAARGVPHGKTEA